MSSRGLDDAAPVLDSPTELFPDGPDPSDIVDREHQRQEELGEAILTALTDPPLSNTRRATTSPPTRQPSIVILSPRLSPPPSPDPTSERLASLVALLHDRRTSNASPPPAPSSPPPNSPPAPGNLSNAAANLTRAEALQRYLDRRLVEGLSALPPRELVDWRIAERRNNNELEMEIQNLLAAAGSTLGRVGDEGEDEGDSPELLFITSLRRGTEARRRRLQGSSAPSMNADGRLLDWDTPLPVRRSILEESRGVGDSQLMELVDTPQSPGRTTGLSGGWDPVMSPEERRARVQMMELAELRGQEERLEEMQRELDALEREEDAEAGTSASRVWRVRSLGSRPLRASAKVDSSMTPLTSTSPGCPTPPHSPIPTLLHLRPRSPGKPSSNPAKKSNGVVAPPLLRLPTPAVSPPLSNTSKPSAPTRTTGALHTFSLDRLARAESGGRGRRRTLSSVRRCAGRRTSCCCTAERERRSCRAGSSGRARVRKGVERWCVRGDWGRDRGGCLGEGRRRRRLFLRICRRGLKECGMWRERVGREIGECWGARDV